MKKSGTNPLAKNNSKNSNDFKNAQKEALTPLYICNKVSMRMKNGTVSVGAIINDEETSYIAEKYFTKESKANSVPNTIHELCNIMDSIKECEDLQEQKTVIAVPNRVAYIANNLGLLTRMIWSGKNLLSKDDKGAYRDMTEKEMDLYIRLANLLCECATFICVMDNTYTHKNKATAITDEQMEWVKVNNAAYYKINHATEPGDDENYVEENTEEDEEE